ncbi:erythrocyte binding antigen-181,putative, partial [Plasmodium sp. gorilla clade G3]
MNMCLFSFYSLLYVVLCTYVLGISENHYYNENISDEQLNERSRTLNDNNNDNNNRNDEISFANEIVRFIENNKDDKEDKNVKIISRPVQNTLNRITGSSFLNIKKYGRKAEYLNRSSFVQRSPVSGCQSKRMEPKWVCENKGNNNICIPDRRIQLCIKPLATIKNSRSEKADSDLLKDTLYASAMYETDLLWKKYGLRRFDNFCDDVKNSYVDYKNVIYGTDIDKNGISALVETALKRFFKEDSTVLNPDAWWAKHGKGLWKSMIRPYESFGCKKPDENEPQVNRWLKEWGKYNCKLMKEKEKFVINECSVNKKKTDCSNSCNNECFNYRNLISRQKYEFTRLANKYIQVIKYSIFKRKLAQPDNAIDFIKVNCSECKDIDFKTLFEFEYGKYEEKCVCQSYIDLRIQFKDQDICSFDPEIDSASNKKKFCLEKPEFKPWQCDKNAFEKFHNEGVCVSPRRQTFCLGNLKYISRDNIYNVHNTQLLMEIIMASKQEGKLLWKKHGLILDNDHACNYINDSYVDYKDVVIGNDLWNDRQSVKVQINLNKIFERNFSYKVGSNKLFKTIKELKTVWWILNRNKIWESLKCGIDEADPRGNSCERIDDLEYVPQFYRWFAQWAHYFCREKEDWEFKLGETCIDTTGKSLCNKETCKNVCTDMNYWIYSRKIAYNIQSSKYYKVRNSFSRAKDKDVSIFLKENTNSCSNIDFTKIFGELDRMFKEKCPCIDIKALEKKNAERLYLEANIGEGRYIDDDDEEDEEPQEYQNYVNVTSGNIDTKSNTKEMVKNKDQKQHQTKGATQSSESLALRD